MMNSIIVPWHSTNVAVASEYLVLKPLENPKKYVKMNEDNYWRPYF